MPGMNESVKLSDGESGRLRQLSETVFSNTTWRLQHRTICVTDVCKQNNDKRKTPVQLHPFVAVKPRCLTSNPNSAAIRAHSTMTKKKCASRIKTATSRFLSIPSRLSHHWYSPLQPPSPILINALTPPQVADNMDALADGLEKYACAELLSSISASGAFLHVAYVNEAVERHVLVCRHAVPRADASKHDG